MAAQEDEALVPGAELSEEREQKGEAGLVESSKAIVAAMLNQDNPDGTDAALMMVEGEN